MTQGPGSEFIFDKSLLMLIFYIKHTWLFFKDTENIFNFENHIFWYSLEYPVITLVWNMNTFISAYFLQLYFGIIDRVNCICLTLILVNYDIYIPIKIQPHNEYNEHCVTFKSFLCPLVIPPSHFPWTSFPYPLCLRYHWLFLCLCM